MTTREGNNHAYLGEHFLGAYFGKSYRCTAVCSTCKPTLNLFTSANMVLTSRDSWSTAKCIVTFSTRVHIVTQLHALCLEYTTCTFK